jgi:hypothetical protein
MEKYGLLTQMMEIAFCSNSEDRFSRAGACYLSFKEGGFMRGSSFRRNSMYAPHLRRA